MITAILVTNILTLIVVVLMYIDLGFGQRNLWRHLYDLIESRHSDLERHLERKVICRY